MIKKVQLTTREGKKVIGCQIIVTSDFDTNIENIWNKIQDVDTLREICTPKASFISCDDSPLIWEEGRSFVFKLFMHRFIPIGKHTINIVKMDKPSRQITSNEYNQTVTIWNHYIEMENAYENLVRKVEELNQPDGDYTIIYRSLNMTRIEFVSLSQHYRYEQGEKCA